MEGEERSANEIMDIAITGMKRHINKSRDKSHQTHGIQRIYHDIKSRTRQINPPSVI